jgi:hypothetical protein
MASFLRKLLPGQPAQVEAVPTFVVLIAGLWAYHQGRRLPAPLAALLLMLASLQIVYAFLGIFADARLTAATLMTRVVPMLMALVAYASIRTWSDLVWTAKWMSGIVVLMLPIGVAVTLGGTEAVPPWLQPIESITLAGRDIRSGLSVVAGLFSTQWIMSLSLLAIVFLALSVIAVTEAKHTPTVWWWLMVASALLLVYLSTRRGAFIVGSIGIVTFILSRRLSIRALLSVAVVGILISLVDAYGVVLPRSGYETRSEFLSDIDVSDRVSSVFERYTSYWLETTPLGNYLGYAGPEGRALGVGVYEDAFAVVEVGGAQLAAEMGMVGMLLMPLMLAGTSIYLVKRARRLKCQNAVYVLVIFQIGLFVLYYSKELLALSNVSLAQFFFWAVPGISMALIAAEEEASVSERVEI